MVSLGDIAKEIKVSKTAVSKVLNNMPIRISERKRKQIIELARRLNYRPNIIARSLQNKKSRSVGIVIPDINTLFYPNLIKEIEIRLFEYGYQTIICNTSDNPEYEKHHIENLISRLVDGLIVAPASSSKGENLEMFRRIKEMDLPLIFIDRYFPEENFNFIITDNKTGARKAVQILAKQGIKELIYIGEKKRNYSINDRLEGVKEEAANQNIIFNDHNIFLCHPSRHESYKICFFIIQKKLRKDIGFFFESNRFVMGLLDAAKEQSLFIPEDIKIVGFDPFEPKIISFEDFESLKCIKGHFPVVEQDVNTISKLISEYMLSSLDIKECERNNWQTKVPVKINTGEQ